MRVEGLGFLIPDTVWASIQDRAEVSTKACMSVLHKVNTFFVVMPAHARDDERFAALARPDAVARIEHPKLSLAYARGVQSRAEVAQRG